MKNIFKVFTLVLLALFMVVGLTACDSSKKDQELLNSFLIEQDGKTLTSDFVLPAYLKIEEKGEEVVYDLVWSSNNSAIQLEQRKDEEGKVTDYLAKVTYPEEEAVVTLTVTLGKVSKDFTVRVSPVDVYNFSGTYVFPNDKQKVYKDFDLDQECAFAGKKATITWSVDEQYQAYIKISADGKKCLVTQNSLDPEVKIKATFSYKNESTTKQYKMTVSQEPTHEEAVSNWYNNPGSPNNFSGWIVEIATVYSESYGNVSFYVLDENEDAGYYGYRVKVAASDASKIKVGAYVTVTGSTNTMYNGLMETNAGALAEFDESKNLTAEQMAAKVKALDEDILAGSPAAFFNQSRLVSLTAWEVSQVGGKDDAFLFKMKKNGVTVEVRTSKYFEGAYNVAKDEEMAPFNEFKTTLKAGDFVTVTGILGRYESEHPEDLQKGINISPLKPEMIQKVEAEAADAAHPGKDVKALIDKLNEVMPTTGIVPANTEITYPISNEAGATVSLEVLHGNTNVVANNTEGKLTLTPSIEEKVSVLATFTKGEYATQIVYIIHLKSMTPEQLVDATMEALEFEDINTFGELPYPTKNTTYGTTITYTLVSAETDNVKVKDGKINVSPLAEEEITLKVTVASGETTKEKEVKVKLLKLEPSTIAEFLAMKKGDMAILEGVIVAVNSDSGVTGFILKDETGAIYSHNSAAVILGDTVKLVGALAFNYDTPQIANVQVIEQTKDAQADLAKALAAAGTPTELEASAVKEKLGGTNRLDSNVAVVKEYSGKFFKVHGYIIQNGTYLQLMSKSSYTAEELAGDEGFGYVSVYASKSISAASYAGKEVYLYGFFRGNNLSKGYITLQVTKLELVNAADGADCLQAEKATVMAGESTEIKVTKAPWAQDVTLAAESADTSKATVAVVDGKVMVTGVSAAEEVEITITPSTGNAIKVKVEVKAADAQPITLAEFLAAAEGTEGLLIEGVVTSIKVSSKGPKSFHLTDAAGTTVFCYDGLEGIFLGQTLRLTAKRGQNYAMPQISTPTIVSKSEATADNLEAALAALGTPAKATLADIAAGFLAEGAVETELVAQFAGKLLKLGGYLEGTKLYTEKGVTTFNAGLYGNQQFDDYNKKNVEIQCIIRGTNLSGKYIQVAVITIVESANQPEPEQEPAYTYVGKGTEAEPYTPNDALHLAADFTQSKYNSSTKQNEYGTLQMVYVQGKVVDQGTDQGTYVQNFKLAVDGVEAQLIVYTCNETDEIKDVRLNDTVVVYGYLMNYNGTVEISNGKGENDTDMVYPTFVSVTRGNNTVTVSSTSSDKAIVSEITPAEGANESTFTFKVTPTQGYELVSVKVNGQAVEATEGVYTGKISGPTSISVDAKEAGSVDPVVVYNLDTTGELQGANNSYAGNCDIESDGITWNFTGNSQQHPWRLGGKSITEVDKTIYTKTVLAQDMTKVVLKVGSATDITVNSLKLEVATDAEFTQIVSTVNGEFAANSDITFARPDEVSWANCYYRFTFNVTVSLTSNKFVQFKGVDFYAVQ